MEKSKWLKWGIVVGVIFTIVMVVIGSYTSAHNTGNKLEKSINAQWNSNQNVLSAYHLKIKEMVQVPAMYVEDFKKVVTESLEGRYGANGSQATMQWIKEHDIKFDSSMHKALQQAMEAGRDEFKNSQDKLLDKKRIYETKLGNLWEGFWMRRAGLPKVNLDDFNIVIAGSAAAVFKSGVDEAIQLR